MISNYILPLCAFALVFIPFIYWVWNRPFGSNSPWHIFSRKKLYPNGRLYTYVIIRTRHGRNGPIGRLVAEAKKKKLRSPTPEEFYMLSESEKLISSYRYVNIKEQLEFSGAEHREENGHRKVSSIDSIPTGDGLLYVFVPIK